MAEYFSRILELFGRPEFSLIEAHQASTHLSIGLIIGAVLFDIGAFVFRKPSLREAAFWSQMLGTVLLVATFLLGYFGNPLAGKSNELAQKADIHFYVGCATLVVFAILALWRKLRQKRMARIETTLYVLTTAAGVALISVAGWMGGQIME